MMAALRFIKPQCQPSQGFDLFLLRRNIPLLIPTRKMSESPQGLASAHHSEIRAKQDQNDDKTGKTAERLQIEIDRKQPYIAYGDCLVTMLHRSAQPLLGNDKNGHDRKQDV